MQYYCNGECLTRKRSIAERPMDIRMKGYEVVEKTAMQSSTSAVPKDWIGKRVRAVRVDP